MYYSVCLDFFMYAFVCYIFGFNSTVCSFYVCLYFFVCKQKTAYELRISVWSSDVCSSDLSRRPEACGQGAIEGIAAPESANNAAAQTAFVPTLALGIPGSPTMAVIIGALMIHGIIPGPTLISAEPELFWGLVASFWIGNLLLLVLNIPLIGFWVSFLNIPYRYLYPAIVVLICLGSFSLSNSVFDVYLTLLFGVAGYLLRCYNFSPALLLIGFVLSPLLEATFRRALIDRKGG